MNELQEGLTQSWETLTGVFDDDKSKLIRIAGFVVMFLGIIWAGLSYFQAQKIADLEEDYSPSDFQASSSGSDTINKLADLAQTVGTMRRGGEAIADSISSMNSMPFNIAGYDEAGLEDLNSTAHYEQGHRETSAAEDDSNHDNEPQQEEQREELLVRALMISKRKKYAIIDYANKEGYVIHQGQNLPGDAGRVVLINKEGLTVNFNGKEITYTIK